MYNYIKPDHYDQIKATATSAASVSNAQNDQHHTHEYACSTEFAAPEINLFHNHRFAGVTGAALYLPDGGHVHRIGFVSDYTRDHFHMFEGETGPAILVEDGKHIHYIKGRTSSNSDHLHAFKLVLQIDDPAGQ